MPRDPPVIKTFFPWTENKEFMRVEDEEAEAPALRIALAVTMVVDMKIVMIKYKQYVLIDVFF